MLAPYSEATDDDAMLALCCEGLAVYPAFVDELRERVGVDAHFVRGGALHVALDAARFAQLQALADVYRAAGAIVRLLGVNPTFVVRRRNREHVEETRHRPPLTDFAFECGDVLRFGCASSGKSPIQPPAFARNRHGVVAPEAVVQRLELRAHLVAQLGDEEVGMGREAEGGVVDGALYLKIRGHVIVGIAVAIGAGDVDLLAAHLIAQRVEGGDFVGDPVDARPPVDFIFNDRVAPKRRHKVERHVFVGGKVVQLRSGVLFDDLECPDDGAMDLVIRAEVERHEQFGDHLP